MNHSSHRQRAHPQHAAIIGLPFEGGQPRSGAALGPRELLNGGLAEEVKKLGYTVETHVIEELAALSADKSVHKNKVRNSLAVGKANKLAHDAIVERLRAGNFCLNLGGDHSLAVGTVSAALEAHPDTCVLWIDAHADINSDTTTSSGNMHGMPVSFLLGLNSEVIPGFEWLKAACLHPDRIAYIGLRDVEAGEREYLRRHRIVAYSMHDVDHYGIKRVVDMALSRINPRDDRPIHLSLDIDGLDPSVCPSTGTAVRGGLSFREGRYIAERCYQSGRLISMDIVELNPQIDPANAAMTVGNSIELAKAALGFTLV